MSWQDIIDNQLVASQQVSKAAILGLDGSIWCKSSNFNVSQKIRHNAKTVYLTFKKKSAT